MRLTDVCGLAISAEALSPRQALAGPCKDCPWTGDLEHRTTSKRFWSVKESVRVIASSHAKACQCPGNGRRRAPSGYQY
jgi:hypothetical protein